MAEIKTQLRDYIAQNLLFSENGFPHDDEASFLEEGIVDSMGVMELVAFPAPGEVRHRRECLRAFPGGVSRAAGDQRGGDRDPGDARCQGAVVGETGVVHRGVSERCGGYSVGDPPQSPG